MQRLAIGWLALAATEGPGLLVFAGLLLGGFVAGIFGTAGASEVGVVAGGQQLRGLGCFRGVRGGASEVFPFVRVGHLVGEFFVAIFGAEVTPAFDAHGVVFGAMGCDRGLRPRGTRIGEERTDARAFDVLRRGK